MLRFDVLEDRLTPATRLVTTLADPVAPPSREPSMTLRQAINELNTFPNESNSITFDPGLVGDVTLDFALPAIIATISIDGDNRVGVTRDNANPLDFRIFHVSDTESSAGNLSLLRTRISGGYVSDGGGILVDVGATAYLLNTAVFGNWADDGQNGGAGGGIQNNGTLICDLSNITGNWASSMGGGIYNTGSLFVQEGSLLAGNHADFDGGAIYCTAGATADIIGCQIENNWAGNPNAGWTGRGGGIFNFGTLLICGATLSGNSTFFTGCQGGGLYCGTGSTATLSSVTVTNNSASNGNNDGMGGGFYLRAGATLTMNDCTLSGNQADVLASVGGWKEVGSTFTWTGNRPADAIGPQA